jgi:hypothetical protein
MTEQQQPAVRRTPRADDYQPPGPDDPDRGDVPADEEADES